MSDMPGYEKLVQQIRQQEEYPHEYAAETPLQMREYIDRLEQNTIELNLHIIGIAASMPQIIIEIVDSMDINQRQIAKLAEMMNGDFDTRVAAIIEKNKQELCDKGYAK